MKRTAIIVVDMIAAYLESGQPLYCEKCREIIPNIDALCEFGRAHGMPIYFSNTALSSMDDPIAKKWGMHARAGTEECKVANGITVEPSDHIVSKTSYNAFFKTDLDALLKAAAVERLVIVGIHTHVCVLLTSAAASDLGYEVIALEDCMTTSYPANHQSRLRFFSTHIGKLMKLTELKSEVMQGS